VSASLDELQETEPESEVMEYASIDTEAYPLVSVEVVTVVRWRLTCSGGSSS
jgi:hypothetical protein